MPLGMAARYSGREVSASVRGILGNSDLSGVGNYLPWACRLAMKDIEGREVNPQLGAAQHPRGSEREVDDAAR
jgi:hypothetical protein